MSSRISDSSSKNNRNNCITACKNISNAKECVFANSHIVCKYLCDDKKDRTWARVSRRLKALCTLCHVVRCVKLCERDWKLCLQGTSQLAIVVQQPVVRSSTVTCGWQDTDCILSRRCDGWMNLDWWILKFLLLASPSTERSILPQTLLKTNSPFSSRFTSGFDWRVGCVYENHKRRTPQRKSSEILKFFWLSTRVCASFDRINIFVELFLLRSAATPFWPA